MSFSQNSDFNFNTKTSDTLSLDQTAIDHTLKQRLFKITDFINILNLDEKFKLEYFYKYENLICILKNIKNLLDKMEININQSTFNFDEIFLNYYHERIKIERTVKKDDRINEIIYYISTIIEFITFYKSNLILDKYFINLRSLLIEIIQLLKILLEKIMPIQEKIYVHSIEYQPIINNIFNKLLELKNISKFWIYIISQIPKNTKKVVIFDYENLKYLSSNYASPEINQIYDEANVINKLCASINSRTDNNQSGIILKHNFSHVVERKEYLQENGQGAFPDIQSFEFYPHSSNCFINHKGVIIKPEEVTLIFIYKSFIEYINIYPILLLQKYNYNILKINVSAIISLDGVKLDMNKISEREQLNIKSKHDTKLQYLKGFDDSFCLFLLYTLKQNTDFAVFLLSADKYVDIRGNLNNINDFFNKTSSNYIDKIIINNINDSPINFEYDLSLMNIVDVDVKKIYTRESSKQIYRKKINPNSNSNSNFNTNYYIFYKKYLKYKQKYLKLKNNKLI